MRSASARLRARVANAVSKSLSAIARATRMCTPILLAASCTVAASRSAFALFGLISTAMTLAAGTSSCKSPSCFAGSGPAIRLNPVRLPPGRLRLGIRLPWTGWMAVMNTMGIVGVAALAASAEGPSPATRTVTCHQLRRHRRQAIVLTLGPEVLDRDVLAFDIAGFGQRLPKADQQWPAVRERR